MAGRSSRVLKIRVKYARLPD